MQLFVVALIYVGEGGGGDKIREEKDMGLKREVE